MKTKFKSCLGCKHLSGANCRVNAKWVRKVDPYSNAVTHRLVAPIPSARHMRTQEYCGSGRLLFEPTWTQMIWNFLTLKWARGNK